MPNDTTNTAPDGRAELKPCPFCGGDDLQFLAAADSGQMSDYSSVTCMSCMSHGPWDFIDEKTASAWNTRTPPQVKPLVWESIDYGYKSDDGFWFKCRTIVGDYSLYMHRSGAFSVWNDSKDLRLKHNCQSIDAAQAAAQADYTRRILEALA